MKMKLQNIAGLAMAVVGAGLLSGCSSNKVNTVERADPIGHRQMVNDKRIITDSSLNRAVRIVGVNEDLQNEFLKIQVELLNTTRSVKNFSYLFEWYDSQGMQVAVPSAYTQRQVEGKESIFITSTAPTPKAKDFRLKLIETIR